MFTVALIGVDGAGKSTVAEKLETSFSLPVKLIYMGLNTQSSNLALPTSRIVYRFKVKKYKREAQSSGVQPRDKIPAYYKTKGRKLSLIWRLGQFVNRLAEVIYRQVVVWVMVRRGYIVVFDRHYLFEYSPNAGKKHKKNLDRLFYWIVKNMFPAPDMSILLDASAEVLFARKQESTIERMNRRRMAYLEVGKTLDNFTILDASESPDEVYDKVCELIDEYQTHLST